MSPRSERSQMIWVSLRYSIYTLGEEEVLEKFQLNLSWQQVIWDRINVALVQR